MATTRYNSRAVANMIATLQAWYEQTITTLNNEESRDYPDQERIEALETRLDAITGAIDALQEIEQ